MKKINLLLMLVAVFAMASCSKYRYETVSGDSTATRIYTLDNGLKVYMSVNKEKPRVQTLISVRVGAKNDPAETTGLAHYFEHLMFKGTEQFGTQDYAAEKPLLDEIERLFEVYRATTDDAERKAIYAQIDSVSQEASKLAIPNEYDKLMTAIGASGSNAWTSSDETTYIENIPSNQIENWAKIQADRFENAVIRGFHTELETVYEEYNMGLTDDGGKAFEKLVALAMPNHPYGHHPVIGLQEHLKNPSITNIKEYYKTYYVPNNMAICMVGDFDPDKTIEIIDKYFGGLKPNGNLPEPTVAAVEPVAEPRSADVYGLEMEAAYMAWTTGDACSDDALMLDIVSNIVYNGKCGLFDTDLLQKQKILGGAAIGDQLSDAGFFIMIGAPKQGQTLEEVRDLMLGEVARLRNGEFDEELLESIIANFKRERMSEIEDNFQRAYMMAHSFIHRENWADVVSTIDRASKITKEDVVAWAQKRLTDNGYSIVFKRQGEDKNQKKIEKPQITPIATNRDETSEFLASIQNSQVAPVEPVFIDFDKDMAVTKMNGNIDVLYKKNETNDLFSLIYLYDFGTMTDPKISAAVEYMNLLGTDTKSLEEIQRELYALACDFNISTTRTRTYVTINGIAENMEKAMAVVEDYMANVQGDEAVLAEVKNDLLKMRENNKLEQRANFGALTTYCMYGPELIRRSTLTNDALKSISSEELLSCIRGLSGLRHRVLYYGPVAKGKLVQTLNNSHHLADNLVDVEYEPAQMKYVTEPTVTFAQYDAKQVYYRQYSCREQDKFDVALDPLVNIYNSYFAGGMNSIVFQEMREARGLAYSAYANLAEGLTGENPYCFSAFIATQNDKIHQAVEAFDEIIENMPQSEAAFELSKQGILANIATNRTTKMSVLWTYVDNLQMGIDSNIDRNKAVYEQIKDMTLADVVEFQQNHIRGRKYDYCILGDKNDLDMAYLRSLGKLNFVSQEEIFGY